MTTVLLFAFGVGLLIVAWKAHKIGEIPSGVAGLKSCHPSRQESPLTFHIIVILYICGGLALLMWGILAIAGAAGLLTLT